MKENLYGEVIPYLNGNTVSFEDGYYYSPKKELSATIITKYGKMYLVIYIEI